VDLVQVRVVDLDVVVVQLAVRRRAVGHGLRLGVARDAVARHGVARHGLAQRHQPVVQLQRRGRRAGRRRRRERVVLQGRAPAAPAGRAAPRAARPSPMRPARVQVLHIH